MKQSPSWEKFVIYLQVYLEVVIRRYSVAGLCGYLQGVCQLQSFGSRTCSRSGGSGGSRTGAGGGSPSLHDHNIFSYASRPRSCAPTSHYVLDHGPVHC